MKKLAALLFLASLTLGGPAAAAGQVEIRYIPFDMATYIAITPDNIAGGALYSVTLDQDTARFRELADLIAGAGKGPSLDEAKVRASIAFPDGRVVFLDQSGGIRRAEGDFGLDDSERRRADALLTEITGAPLSGNCFAEATVLASDFVAASQNWADLRHDALIVSSDTDAATGLCAVRIGHQAAGKWVDLFVDIETGGVVREVRSP